MKVPQRKSVFVALLGAITLLAGCGSRNSNSGGLNNGFLIPGPGGGGLNGCYRADQPVPFTVSNAYLSGTQLCTSGTTVPCPQAAGMASIGGTGATQGYFTDIAVDGVQSARMDIIPYSTSWQPNGLTPPMTANARGTFQLGPVMLNYLRTLNGGNVPCITRVLGVSTGFDPYGGYVAGRTALYSTRIVIQWQGSASGTEELQM